MASLPTLGYSPRNVAIVYGPFVLKSGRANETFVTISRNTQRASVRMGFGGDPSVALTSDHSYTITLSFFPEYDSAKLLNAYYQGLAAAERAGKPYTGALPLVITDPTGLNSLVCNEAMIMEHGDFEYGEDTGVITFTFLVPEAVQGPLPTELAGRVSNALKGVGVDLNLNKLIPSLR